MFWRGPLSTLTVAAATQLPCSPFKAGQGSFYAPKMAFISFAFSQLHFPKQDIKGRETKGFRGFFSLRSREKQTLIPV